MIKMTMDDLWGVALVLVIAAMIVGQIKDDLYEILYNSGNEEERPGNEGWNRERAEHSGVPIADCTH